MTAQNSNTPLAGGAKDEAEETTVTPSSIPRGRVGHALDLAARGLYLFPLAAGRKDPPVVPSLEEYATRDERVIRSGWGAYPEYNVAVYTHKFGNDQALLVVDIDVRKDGFASLAKFEAKHGKLPSTFTVRTPTNGEHRYYSVPAPVKPGVDVLGPGIDVKSKGSYVVAPGSVRADMDGAAYVIAADVPIVAAPQWLVDLCGVATVSERNDRDIATANQDKDQDLARQRALEWLDNRAPLSIKGEGGDKTAFVVACQLRDFGLTADNAFELMTTSSWYERSEPGWKLDKLRKKVDNAFRYAENREPGTQSDEAALRNVPTDRT